MTTADCERPVVKDTSGTDTFFGWVCILYNCNCHSFQDVASQLMKAVRCSYAQGMKYATEVHTKGSAVVYRGYREKAEAVSARLEEIGLRTQVSQ